jgi:hypothetical protein
MTRPQKVGLGCFIFTVVFLLIVLSFAGSSAESDISIDFAGNSNSPAGPVAKLRLSNNGGTAVRINANCTLYWTNRLGVATNEFFRHDQGYAILKPHESTYIAIPHPSDAEVWETSFTYQVRPNAIKRVCDRIRFCLPGKWVPDNSFIGRFSPLIRNPMAVARESPSNQE